MRSNQSGRDFLRLLRFGWKAKGKSIAPTRQSAERIALNVESLALRLTTVAFFFMSLSLSPSLVTRHSTLAPSHLMTRSANISMSGGMVTPISLAVFRLITSLNCVGSSTGSSAGFAPLKILSTTYAALRNCSIWFAP